MQPTSLFPQLEDHRLEEIDHLLRQRFGPPPQRDPWDPLTQFIYSVLSSRTKTETSHAVLKNLRTRFGTWENLRDASIPDIEDAIREATFPEQKAVQLKEALQQITARVGTLTLDFLAKYQTEKIRTWLEQFPGAGPKTSAAVVNFSTLRRRALAMDAHHLRVAHRLGLVPRLDATHTETRLMRLVPEAWSAEQLDDHHQLIKKLGQEICTFEQPKCPQCPLLKLCPTGQRNTAH